MVDRIGPAADRNIAPVPLFRKVEAAAKEIVARDRRGTLRRMAGVGLVRSRLRTCLARYVLDPATSAACVDAVERDVLGAADVLRSIRLPAETFWVEWLVRQEAGAALKLGAMVEGDAGGRSGRLTCYHERPDGRADLLIMQVSFDLDRPSTAACRAYQARLRHADLVHLNGLLGSALAEVHPSWRGFLASYEVEDRRQEMSHLAESVWSHLPTVLMFAHLLAARRAVVVRPERARPVAAAPGETHDAGFASLDVSLVLNPGNAEPCAIHMGDRHAPRAHQVRGHYVVRGEKRFWRTSHVRGAGNGQLFARTVHVFSDMRRPLPIGDARPAGC